MQIHRDLERIIPNQGRIRAHSVPLGHLLRLGMHLKLDRWSCAARGALSRAAKVDSVGRAMLIRKIRDLGVFFVDKASPSGHLLIRIINSDCIGTTARPSGEK